MAHVKAALVSLIALVGIDVLAILASLAGILILKMIWNSGVREGIEQAESESQNEKD
jgi:hypothetical protein